MTTYLEAVVRHRRRAAADGRPLVDLVAQAGCDAVLVGRSFVGAGGLGGAGRAVAELVAAGR